MRWNNHLKTLLERANNRKTVDKDKDKDKDKDRFNLNEYLIREFRA